MIRGRRWRRDLGCGRRADRLEVGSLPPGAGLRVDTPNRTTRSLAGDTDRSEGPPGSLGTPRTRTRDFVTTVPEAFGAGTRIQCRSTKAKSAVPPGSHEMSAPGRCRPMTRRSRLTIDSTTTRSSLVRIATVVSCGENEADAAYFGSGIARPVSSRTAERVF